MQKIYVLDHGYVELIRVEGDDEFLAQTARTSTESSGDPEKDAKLVTRLVRDRHTSPIEFGGFVFELYMPIFVARQWMRHRTGTFNEFSMRYSEAKDDYYLPALDRCQAQSTFNKQGSAEVLPEESAEEVIEFIEVASEAAFAVYQTLLRKGLTRELARMVLPVNYYTKMRWRVNLHNLMHFLTLREDPHAQYEIRVYAEALHQIMSEHFPVATKAFEQHIQNKVTISPSIAALLAKITLDQVPQELQSEFQELTRRYSNGD